MGEAMGEANKGPLAASGAARDVELLTDSTSSNHEKNNPSKEGQVRQEIEQLQCLVIRAAGCKQRNRRN